ncbi:MAG: dnaQ [Francisellaceae bacterium]|nr:dnaQ [Francisellaceae bacterium]
MRQILFDTETTGLSPEKGHRLTEIGCLEMVNRKLTGRSFHSYLHPEREVDAKAEEITGLNLAFLKDKPKFIEVVEDFLYFIKDSELIIHNAPFDVGFINHELNLIKHPLEKIEQIVTVTDTLLMARKRFPGQKNNLDALCKRYNIDNSNRTLHGALLDADILAKVYLAMTAGQTVFSLNSVEEINIEQNLMSSEGFKISRKYNLKVLKASREELKTHIKQIELLQKVSGENRWDAYMSEAEKV